jgi:CBS domain-containing protein
LGFQQVFRYTRGKADWLANGLPREGGPDEPSVANLLSPEVPTCHPDERVDVVMKRVGRRTRWCVVVNEDRVVLGLLRVERRGGEAGQVVQDAMRAAPLTIRPNTTPKDARRYAKGRRGEPLVVTTSDGRLVGLLEASQLGRSRSVRPEEQRANV